MPKLLHQKDFSIFLALTYLWCLFLTLAGFTVKACGCRKRQHMSTSLLMILICLPILLDQSLDKVIICMEYQYVVSCFFIEIYSQYVSYILAKPLDTMFKPYCQMVKCLLNSGCGLLKIALIKLEKFLCVHSSSVGVWVAKAVVNKISQFLWVHSSCVIA